ncbi:MAG: hypothetical protein J7518_18220 [Nocardioidaceae bacterium]|nr:hypothetical protein [Nocardioidaceae bacterium]
MELRSTLRTAARFILSAALVVTVSQVVGPSPAQADGPVTVITSPPLDVGGGTQPPPLIVQKTDPVGGSVPITVTNPGGTAPTAPECLQLQETGEQFCLGSSGDALYPNGTPIAPLSITNGFTAPGDLPGDQMDWIMQEAYASTADTHGVDNDDLVKAFARPEIRAYVEGRLSDIVNKKLYGEPMTDQENAAFDALEQYYKQNQVKAAKAALYEFQLWDSNPCAYVPPAPPAGSGLAPVPNPVIGTAACSAANKVDIWKLTKGTPPAETFEKWAGYRHPKSLVLHANDPQLRYMTGKTREAIVGVGALGVIAAAGAGVGLGAAASYAVATAADAALAVTEEFGAAVVTDLSLGSTAAVAGPAIIIAIAIVIIAVAIWQMDEDAKPGEQITDRAAQAVSNDDPLGVRSRIGDYASLSHQDYLDRKDPDGQAPAVVHTDAFKDGLEAQIAEWMMFDQGGDLLPDPALGYTVTQSTPDDLHFAENGGALPYVEVKAPAGALDRGAHPVSDYRVLFSRGWPMVSERRADLGSWSAFRPRLTLTYLDENGKIAQMSILRHQEGDEPVQLDFSLTRPDLPVAQRFSVAPTWTFTQTGGGLRTVSLLPFDPVLRPVNVVPSVQGILVADNVVTLSSNLSTPGQSLPGSFGWTLERLHDDGTVAETIPLPGDAAVSRRLLDAGRYRATATYTVDGPPQFARSGVVEFTMLPPAPEVMTAQVRDDRVLDGSLFLDLRMLQSTRSDDFTVHVDWADDGRGNVVSTTYTVHCQDTGSDVATCDTGPMILPEEAPTNANWSESPTFRIPDEQDFLPQVTVTITNGYGQVVTRSFPVGGDHRPSYASRTPSAEMPAGTFSRVDVVEVFPSPLLVDSQDLTILPYVQSIAAQLPEGVHPDIEERNGHWYLQVAGTPQADAIGPYVFYFPFEQEPTGSGFRPAPALVTLEVKAATQPGYRSILRGTPSAFLQRQYRNVYPPYQVQVAQVLGAGESAFGTFTGTVKCRLTAGPTVVFDKPCANNQPFPWPAERISDTLEASTYVESATQPVSADGPYAIDLSTKFVDPKVTRIADSALLARFTMTLRDLNIVLPPFGSHGYQVACSRDGAAFAACFDSGSLSLPRVPGSHTLLVRATAPDHAATTVRVPWAVATPPATFVVQAPGRPKRRGTKVLIAASRLLPGEAYVIRIGTRTVASGKATLAGTVRRWVVIPRATRPGRVTVTVRGATARRLGRDVMRVVR